MTETRTKEEIERINSEGMPPSARGVALLDYDGTIFPFGGLHDQKEPKPGAVETIQWLKEQGWTIVIFTSRLSPSWHRAEGWDEEEAYARELSYVKGHLDRWSIPYDDITSEKRPGSFILDDTAIPFKDDWNRARVSIERGGRNFDESKLSYASGFFDGEGCIAIGFYWRNKNNWGGGKAGHLTVSASQVVTEPLELLRSLWGGNIGSSQRKGTTTIHTWKLSGRDASRALEDMLPFLLVKKKEAVAAIGFQATMRQRLTNGGFVSVGHVVAPATSKNGS